jgi:hypothetical protein
MTMQPNPILQFIPLMIISLVMGFVARALAKDKGRNVLNWTVLGFLPIINFMCAWYFVGATNLRMERKIDALLSAQGKDPKIFD